MGKLVARLDAIQERLDALARLHKVPGASLAVLEGDQVLEFATGVVNITTGVETTPATLFQIGSNTKVYTTTLLMQLVDQGKVDIDRPVRAYVSDFKVADSNASATITVRHLLTHSSGIQGDHFEDFGRGDDGISKYVDSMSELTQVTPPGAMFSYCNSGFVLAGYIVERVTGKPYHQALKEMLLEPLGLRATTVLAEEMLAFRYAVGHMPGPNGEPAMAPTVLMGRASAPAGSVTSATARDVLGFVKMHLDLGRAPDGSRVLSEKSVRAMQQPQVRVPGRTPAGHVGLGWMLDDWDGQKMIGHGGGTIGQLSFLHALPERHLAACLLTNSGTGALLWRDLGRWLFDDLVGVTVPEVPKPADPPPSLDLRRYTGRYERLSVSCDLAVEGGELVATMTPTGPLAALGLPPQQIRFQPVDDETFHVAMGGGEGVAVFLDFDARGRPQYLHLGGRVSARTEGPRARTAKKAAKAGRPAKKAPRKAAATR